MPSHRRASRPAGRPAGRPARACARHRHRHRQRQLTTSGCTVPYDLIGGRPRCPRIGGHRGRPAGRPAGRHARARATVTATASASLRTSTHARARTQKLSDSNPQLVLSRTRTCLLQTGAGHPLKPLSVFVLPRVGNSSLDQAAGGGASCVLQCYDLLAAGPPSGHADLRTTWPRRPPMPCRVS